MIPILFNFLKKEESELCKDIKKNLEKFSKYNNIHRSLLYEYKLFCEENKDSKR